jgi:acyl-CoA reductase-like NAD-dependent aldehyde dehydrogenase
MRTITKHYIGGAFVESHGREVMDSINPSNGQVIARVTLGDEEDARRAIAAAKRAFAGFARTTKEKRASVLRRLHEVVSARVDDLTAAMVEEYGGVVRFAAPIVQAGANAFALRGLSVPRRPRSDQRHARRSAGALRRIQALRRRPRIRDVRDRGVSRAEGHPRVTALAALNESTQESGL